MGKMYKYFPNLSENENQLHKQNNDTNLNLFSPEGIVYL